MSIYLPPYSYVPWVRVVVAARKSESPPAEVHVQKPHGFYQIATKFEKGNSGLGARITYLGTYLGTLPRAGAGLSTLTGRPLAAEVSIASLWMGRSSHIDMVQGPTT